MSNSQPDIYQIPRQFLPESKLILYLMKKLPSVFDRIDKVSTLQTVLDSILHVIQKERLLCQGNSEIILCDNDLKQATKIPKFHKSQLEAIIVNQMKTVDPELVYSSPSPLHSDANCSYNTKKISLRAKLMKFIKTIDGMRKRKNEFTFKELFDIITTYISQKKEILIHNQNTQVVHIENDPLGRALGIKAFHTSQFVHLLKYQTIPLQQTRKQGRKKKPKKKKH